MKAPANGPAKDHQTWLPLCPCHTWHVCLQWQHYGLNQLAPWRRMPDSKQVAVFDLDPGTAHGKTSITMRYYHAVGADRAPSSDYELFDTLVLAKDRRDKES